MAKQAWGWTSAAQLSVPVATLGLSDFARLYTQAEWFDVVTHGDPGRFMPAFSDLTDRQRWDVVAYAMNLSVSDELVVQGEAIYQESCVSCHGVIGKGDGPSVEGLSVKPQDLTDQSLMAKNSAVSLYHAISSGISPDMPAYADLFTDEEHWALVAYIRSLAYTYHETGGEAYPAPNEILVAASTVEPSPSPQAYPPPAVTQSPGVTGTFTISSSQPFFGTVAVQLINGSSGDAFRCHGYIVWFR
jgi:mono/diheme cytochrome c family protein